MTSLPSWSDYGTYDESAYPDLWNGVVGYWAPCLGPTGLRLHDVSRNGNWGTLTNMDAATDWVVSDGRYALDYDGVNDYVEISSQLASLNGKSQITLAAWMKRRQSNSVVSVGRATQNNYINIIPFSDGNVYFQIAPNFHTVNDNSTDWRFWVMTLKASVIAGYRNGVQVVTGAGPAALPTTNRNWEIGYYLPANTYTNGLIDEFIIFDRALSANEVRNLHQLGRGGMLERRRRRRAYIQQAGFRPHYAQRNAQLIGGGLR